MELDKELQDLLLAIHQTDDERLGQKDIADSNEEQLLTELIQKELIEFDPQDDHYYLTYEGYTWVEYFLEEDSSPPEKQSSSPHLYTRLAFFLLSIGIYWLILWGFGKQQSSSEEVLMEETLYQIKKDIEPMLDSVLQERAN